MKALSASGLMPCRPTEPVGVTPHTPYAAGTELYANALLISHFLKATDEANTMLKFWADRPKNMQTKIDQISKSRKQTKMKTEIYQI